MTKAISHANTFRLVADVWPRQDRSSASPIDRRSTLLRGSETASDPSLHADFHGPEFSRHAELLTGDDMADAGAVRLNR
ncbi:MAG: hypothetical protein IOC64_03755 [Methylobacterium sp.]|nr:hypothetical protein [Methylobacterium sp.]MCA3607271.1 hypothetical protein [Methylobacterium sp.]MCA3610156.1 hypothetical protein [Methylobacterium sp.]MCA3617080.1 hypothetical protein [Methylobacterium sp.]MCA3619688.1 hypothetical protein [Methylobacterium sp.]